MYWKVLKNNKLIDVLDRLTYLKYQVKNDLVLFTTINDAQLFLSSDEKHIWHAFSLRRLPTNVTKYETVELVEISEEEYELIKDFCLKNVKRA